MSDGSDSAQNGDGYELLGVAQINRISYQGLCPVKAVQVFAGLFHVDFCGLLQNLRVYCKYQGYFRKALFPKILLPLCIVVSFAYCDKWGCVQPRCRAPPFLTFGRPNDQKRRTAKCWSKLLKTERNLNGSN